MFKKSKMFLLLGIIVLILYGGSSNVDKEVYVKEVVMSELSPNGKHQAVILIDGGGDYNGFCKGVWPKCILDL